MPKGPKGEDRSADVASNAERIAKVATGEIEDESPDDGEAKAAHVMGRKGGKARAVRLNREHRSLIAVNAAAQRWIK